MACAPPSETTYLHQSADLVFVDWDGFSKKFKKRAYARMESTPYGLVPKYDLCLWEDAATRAIVIENRYGDEITRLAPEIGFDSLGWAKASLGARSAIELTDFQRIIHDSAHTALAITLTPIEFASVYEVDPYAGLDLQPMAMTMSTPLVPGANQLATLTFSLPAGFSGKGELFQTDSIRYPAWSLTADRIGITNTVEYEWTDPASSNLQHRFYVLGDMEVDEDGDGYSNTRESLITATDPAVFDYVDSDGDGLHDWYEYMLFTNLSQSSGDDADHDGLSNGDEMKLTSTNVVFHSNPSNPDTDGDGTDDGTEVTQGSDPNDAADAGAAPEKIAMILDFEATGDGFSRFSLAVSGEGVELSKTYEDPGVQGETFTLDLIKGQSYAVTISAPESGELGTVGYIASATGEGIVVVDPQNALGDHSNRNFSSAPVTATIHAMSCAFEVQPEKINFGFDNTGTQAWASVIVNSDNPVAQLALSPVFSGLDMGLQPTDETKFSVDPTNAVTAATPFTLSGLAEGETSLKVVAQGQTFAELNVLVLEQQCLDVGLYRICDTNSHDASIIGGPAAAEFESTLNSVYLQCGVQFDVTDHGARHVPFDTNLDGLCGPLEKNLIPSCHEWEDDIVILLMHESGVSYSGTNSNHMVRGLAFNEDEYPRGMLLFVNGPDGLGSGTECALAGAHETGHGLGLHSLNDGGHDDGPAPEGTDALMISGAPVSGVLPEAPGWWIRYEDWVKANDTAERL